MTEYSDEVLEETPERVAKLLNGIGAVPTIRTLLAQGGIDDDDLAEGRALLLAVLGAPKSPEATMDTEEAKTQRDAVAELDEWDEPNFAIHEAALRRRFPEQEKYVFDGLKASTGSRAVTGVATLLARLDTLEKGTDEHRQQSRKQDKEAVEFLAKKKGFDKKERERLGKLVKIALGPTSALPDAPAPTADHARRERLVALKEWYDEVATTAKAKIKKRGSLIRLGLASRKSPKKREPL